MRISCDLLLHVQTGVQGLRRFSTPPPTPPLPPSLLPSLISQICLDGVRHDGDQHTAAGRQNHREHNATLFDLHVKRVEASQRRLAVFESRLPARHGRPPAGSDGPWRVERPAARGRKWRRRRLAVVAVGGAPSVGGGPPVRGVRR